MGWAAPSTSPLSQKKLFTGLGVDSGAKVRNGKQKGKIKRGFLLAVDVTPETVHGSFTCLQQLSQTSTSYSLDSLKYFFPFFHLGVLPQQQECPAGEHSPACCALHLQSRQEEHLAHPGSIPGDPSPVPALQENCCVPLACQGALGCADSRHGDVKGCLDCSGFEHHLLSCWLSSIQVLGQTARSRFLCWPRYLNPTNMG